MKHIEVKKPGPVVKQVDETKLSKPTVAPAPIVQLPPSKFFPDDYLRTDEDEVAEQSMPTARKTQLCVSKCE